MTKFYGVSTGEEIVITAWTIKELGNCDPQCIVEIEMPSIIDLVLHYATFRKLKLGSIQECFYFLTSEVGELADELVSAIPGWVRNNPEKDRGTSEKTIFEIGDVLFMATMLSRWFNIDPLQAMIRKFESKGWKQE